MHASQIVAEFNRALDVTFSPPSTLLEEVERLLGQLTNIAPRNKTMRHRELVRSVNAKFRFNAERVHSLLTTAATNGTTFNYHEKNAIADAYDFADVDALRQTLECIPSARLVAARAADLIRRFDPIAEAETIRLLHAELRNPTLARKDSKPKDWSSEILASLFSAFVYRTKKRSERLHILAYALQQCSCFFPVQNKGSPAILGDVEDMPPI